MEFAFCSRCRARLPAGAAGPLCDACKSETGSDLSARKKVFISLGPTVWLALGLVALVVTAIVWLARWRQ